MQYTRVTLVEKKNMLRKGKSFVDIELPRELILLNPTFSWNQTLMPVENYLKGSYIHLSFETPVNEEEGVLYMTSDYLNYLITIRLQGEKPMVISVSNPAIN